MACLGLYILYEVIWHYMQSKKGGKDQELIQSSTTPDTGYHVGSDKNTIKHYKRELRGQLFPSR